jgi:hypothetical protein
MHYICNGHPFVPKLCQWNLWIHRHLDKQTLHSIMDIMQHCPNHHNKWLFHICELNSTSSRLPIWTHPLWIVLTNLCAIHGMTGVCSGFHIWRLLSQFLWMSSVTWQWRGSSLHKRKLPTSCPNLVFWLNSIP